MYEAQYPDGSPWPVAGLGQAGFGALLPGAPDVESTQVVGGLTYLKFRAQAAPAIGKFTSKKPQAGLPQDAGTLTFNSEGPDWVTEDVGRGNVVMVNATNVAGNLTILYMSTPSPAVVADLAGPAGTMAILAGPANVLATASAAASNMSGGVGPATPTPPPLAPAPVTSALSSNPLFWPGVAAIGVAGFLLLRKAWK